MMKRITVLASLILGVTGLTSPAFGQMGAVLKASIPFPFIVQGAQLPAGNYVIETEETNPLITEIRKVDGEKSVLALTEPADGKGDTKLVRLVFDKIGGEYFLTQIWTGDQWGKQISEAKAEQMLKAAKVRPQ